MPVDVHLLVGFVAVTAVAMVVPGPDMLFILGCGARGGPRAGLLATRGVASSEAIHVALAAAGLAALFEAAPTAWTVVRVVGAVYLVYLGVRALRRHDHLDIDAAPGSASAMSGRQAFRRGFTTNLINPKMVTFTLALLPQFIAPELGHVWLQFVVLGAVTILFEFLVDGTVGVLAGQLADWLRRRTLFRRVIDVTVGGVFIGLGLRLAADSRP